MEQRQMRMIFSKTGNIRFISHLDMTRAFLRAFQRSGIKLRMSEGFSPHPKISFPLPLSVGMESENEILDLTLSETEERSAEEILKLMNENLPDGLQCKKLTEATKKSQAIEFAEYDVTIPSFPRPCGIEEYFSKPVFIKKRTKKGDEKEIDITSGIKSIAFSEEGDGMKIKAVLSASGQDYLNPEFIFRAIGEKYENCPAYCRIRRLRALEKDLKEFN